MMKKGFFLSVIVLLTLLAVACGQDTAGEVEEVRIGYFPNLDHAAAMVGIEEGLFDDELEGIQAEYQFYPNGNDFINALDANELDIGYVGPGPAINYFLGGGDIVVLSSAANGATLIVAREGSGIESLEDLSGKSFCTPGNGCTHNVQLEKMLLDIDLKSDRVGGTVEHMPRIAPASMVGMFEQGQVDVAAAPEPWGTYLVEEGLGHVLVEWDDVQWGQTLSSVVLVSTKKFVEENPEIVKDVLRAHVKSIEFAQQHTNETLNLVNDRIYALVQEELPIEVLEKAWQRMSITYETHGDILQEWAAASKELGFIEEDPDLDGFVDSRLLEEVIAE